MTEAEKNHFYITLGSNIRSARIKAGYKQGAFADLLRLSRASVVNIEKGRQHPPLHLLWDIVKVLKVSYNEIIPYFAFEEEPTKSAISSELEVKIANSIDKDLVLDMASIKKIKSFIKESSSINLSDVYHKKD